MRPKAKRQEVIRARTAPCQDVDVGAPRGVPMQRPEQCARLLSELHTAIDASPPPTGPTSMSSVVWLKGMSSSLPCSPRDSIARSSTRLLTATRQERLGRCFDSVLD